MIFFVTLVACLAIPQNGQHVQESSYSAESVVKKFIVAKGGEPALRKVKNFSITGKVMSKNEIAGQFKIFQAENRHLSIDRFPDGTTRKHGTDGKHAWRIDVDGKPSLLKGQEARDYIRHYGTLHESLEWEKQFDSILYAGQKTVQGTATNHLIFVAPDNRQVNRYFSVETGLLIREEQVNGTGANVHVLVSEIGNYVRDENGTIVSRRRLNYFGSKYSIEYRIESLESNTLDDNSIFAIPDSVAKLTGDPETKFPTFAELKRFAGTKFDTAEFQDFIAQYDFSENHKRDRSWGASIGVFIELSAQDAAIVGVRPIGSGFGQKYPGSLPSNIKQGDPLKTTLEKLGKPLKTTVKKDGYHVLYYEDFHVILTAGSLFEIWITPEVKDVEPRLPKRQRKSKNAG